MERAKQYVAEELQGHLHEVDTHMSINERDDLKKEINSIVHTYCPAQTTLAEAETISMLIMEILTNPKYFLTK